MTRKIKKEEPAELSVIPQEKEIAEYKSEVSAVQKAANDYVIVNQDDLDRGADLLHEVKRVQDIITARKEEITRPLMKALVSARDFFKPLEMSYEDAKKTIKAKMLAYQVEQDEKARIEKERIANRVAKGTMRPDTAIKKMEEINEPEFKGKGSVGKVQTRTIVKVRIVDETSIPREYLVPDMSKITEAILRQGIEIPGVERYEEKQLVSR